FLPGTLVAPTCLDVQALAGWIETHVGGVDVVACICCDGLFSIRQISNVDPSAGHLCPGYVDGDAFASLEGVIPRTRNPRGKSHRDALRSAVLVNQCSGSDRSRTARHQGRDSEKCD